jgi:hypothetical protein
MSSSYTMQNNYVSLNELMTLTANFFTTTIILINPIEVQITRTSRQLCDAEFLKQNKK